MESLQLSDVVTLLTVSQVKQVLDLYGITYTNKDKKPALNSLMNDNNVSVTVVLNFLQLNAEEMAKKVKQARNRRNKKLKDTETTDAQEVSV